MRAQQALRAFFRELTLALYVHLPSSGVSIRKVWLPQGVGRLHGRVPRANRRPYAIRAALARSTRVCRRGGTTARRKATGTIFGAPGAQCEHLCKRSLGILDRGPPGPAPGCLALRCRFHRLDELALTSSSLAPEQHWRRERRRIDIQSSRERRRIDIQSSRERRRIDIRSSRERRR